MGAAGKRNIGALGRGCCCCCCCGARPAEAKIWDELPPWFERALWPDRPKREGRWIGGGPSFVGRSFRGSRVQLVVEGARGGEGKGHVEPKDKKQPHGASSFKNYSLSLICFKFPC